MKTYHLLAAALALANVSLRREDEPATASRALRVVLPAAIDRRPPKRERERQIRAERHALSAPPQLSQRERQRRNRELREARARAKASQNGAVRGA